MIPNNPNELLERCLADLDRMRVARYNTPDSAADVDHSSARLLLEQAIREAFNQGATYGLALAKTAKIELKLCDSSPMSAWLVDLIRKQGGDVTP